MLKLLILTDDFTGALDTGVKFSEKGISTQVIVSTTWEEIDTNCEVLVIDAETRHVSQKTAYERIYQICKKAKQQGVLNIYKKTDSALRGNAGCEIQAVQDAYKDRRVMFIPSLPKMNRVVKDAILYIDGVPVTESVFGQDPFEPVQEDRVDEILKITGYKKCISLISNNKYKIDNISDLLLFDAETQNDLKQIANLVEEKTENFIFAGCAGFAENLPEILNLEKDNTKKYKTKSNLIFICGSVNPITKSQIRYAQKLGIPKITLKPEEKLNQEYWDKEKAKNKINEIIENKGQHFIIDSNDVSDNHETMDYAREKNWNIQEIRIRISQTLGYLTKKIIDKGLNGTFLISGGDTLLGFMNAVDCNELEPVKEICPGCVLTRLEYKNQDYFIITKSGGFGQERLIEKLIDLIKED